MANFEEEMRGHIEVLNREMGDIKIDVEKMLRKLNDMFGFNFIHDLMN